MYIYLISQIAATPGSSTVQSLVTKIGPWGGNGGSVAEVRVSPHRLESVVIRHGLIVDSIGYSYMDQKPAGSTLQVLGVVMAETLQR